MSRDRLLCPICAWRGDCNKKFKSTGGMNCPDFSRDVTIKAIEEPSTQPKKEEKKPKKSFWPI
jgi:hypothetical protein